MMNHASTFFRQHDRSGSLLRAVLGSLSACTCLVLVAPQARGQSSELKAVWDRNQCTACHHWEKKLVGPSFRDVRARYNSADIPRLAQKLLNGGGGVWGATPEVPHKGRLSTYEAEQLVAGILGVGPGSYSSGAAASTPTTNLADDPLSAGGVAKMQ